MNDDHPILTTVGIATVALGVLMVVQPGLAAAVGVDYGAVLLVGLIALVQAVRVARARQASEVRGAETPDVETVESVPTPGEEFDETVATLRLGPRRVLIRERADLREQVEAAAVTAVADRENCSDETARDLIADGTWTDDPHAAAFLGESGVAGPSLFERMKLATRAESRFQYRVRRTADAVARAAGVTPEETDGADEGDGSGPGQAGSDGTGGDGTGGDGTGGDGTGSDGPGSDRTGSDGIEREGASVDGADPERTEAVEA